MTERSRIYLSPPHMTGDEIGFIEEAFRDNWVAPLGPHVDAFEQEFAAEVGVRGAVALSSGTAALHLALITAGVNRGDKVLVSSLTFCASVNPILYVGATPVFLDSERRSWNADPDLVADTLCAMADAGTPPRAMILVHLYGQTANIGAVREACDLHGTVLIEDAAEALGATYQGRPAGSFGDAAIFSFNGNKIITTSGGGMLVSDDMDLIGRARKLATQARDPAPHYQHSEVGFNYRMSNLLAGVGRAQLAALDDRVEARRRNFEYYSLALSHLPGIDFMPEAGWGRHTRWLSCLTISPDEFGADREAVRHALEQENIEARPLWKPMHLQPVYQEYLTVGGRVSEDLFKRGLCLPSGSALTNDDLSRVIDVISGCHRRTR